MLPENRDAFNLFNKVSTQWRATDSGYIGLDYNAVELVMGWFFEGKNKSELFESVQFMERVALGHMNSTNKPKEVVNG